MSAQKIVSLQLLVGMEIHVELATESKMFTSAPNGAVYHVEIRRTTKYTCKPTRHGAPGLTSSGEQASSSNVDARRPCY